MKSMGFQCPGPSRSVPRCSGAHFLTNSYARLKRPCQPGTLYCFHCREPRAPALGMVDFVLMRPGRGNLRALCATCETIMHRRVREGDIAKVMPNCTVQFVQGQPSLTGQAAPSLNCDFKRQGEAPCGHCLFEYSVAMIFGPASIDALEPTALILRTVESGRLRR